MHRSFKQQLLQKSNHLLLNNNLQESTHMESAELLVELNVNSVNNSKHLLQKNKR